MHLITFVPLSEGIVKHMAQLVLFFIQYRAEKHLYIVVFIQSCLLLCITTNYHTHLSENSLGYISLQMLTYCSGKPKVTEFHNSSL